MLKDQSDPCTFHDCLIQTPEKFRLAPITNAMSVQCIAAAAEIVLISAGITSIFRLSSALQIHTSFLRDIENTSCPAARQFLNFVSIFLKYSIYAMLSQIQTALKVSIKAVNLFNLFL